jgi:hypothetical protein
MIRRKKNCFVWQSRLVLIFCLANLSIVTTTRRALMLAIREMFNGIVDQKGSEASRRHWRNRDKGTAGARERGDGGLKCKRDLRGVDPDSDGRRSPPLKPHVLK